MEVRIYILISAFRAGSVKEAIAFVDNIFSRFKGQALSRFLHFYPLMEGVFRILTGMKKLSATQNSSEANEQRDISRLRPAWLWTTRSTSWAAATLPHTCHATVGTASRFSAFQEITANLSFLVLAGQTDDCNRGVCVSGLHGPPRERQQVAADDGIVEEACSTFSDESENSIGPAVLLRRRRRDPAHVPFCRSISFGPVSWRQSR